MTRIFSRRDITELDAKISKGETEEKEGAQHIYAHSHMQDERDGKETFA